MKPSLLSLLAVPAAAAVMALASAAQAQTTPVITGHVTEATLNQFVTVLEGAADRAVSVNVTGHRDGGSDERAENKVFVTGVGSEGRVQIGAPARWNGDSYTISGLFTVQYVSMNQGIMAYWLEPARGTATRPVEIVLGE